MTNILVTFIFLIVIQLSRGEDSIFEPRLLASPKSKSDSRIASNSKSLRIPSLKSKSSATNIFQRPTTPIIQQPTNGLVSTPTGPTSGCHKGTSSEVTTLCGSACCDPAGACASWGANDDGVHEVCQGSCTGTDACTNWPGAGGGTVSVGKNSCVGGSSCKDVDTDSTVEIGENSCLGAEACADQRTGTLVVGENSCTGQGACYFIGGNAASVQIGNRACVATVDACANMGNMLTGDIIVGDDACISPTGESPCLDIAGGASVQGKDITIEAFACQGENACSEMASNAFFNELIVEEGICASDDSCNRCMRNCQCNELTIDEDEDCNAFCTDTAVCSPFTP